MDWLPAAERIVFGDSGGVYTGGPFRIVLHRTQGNSLAGALSVYRVKNVAPHITVEIREAKGRRIVQHTPFTVAARALENQPGGVQTNRRSAIQIEVVGFSEKPKLDLDSDLRWFGATILKPIMQAFSITPDHPTFWGAGCGWTLASTKAKQRMTFTEWDAFNGICSHQHVPEQSHWDCGAFKIDAALAGALEDDDMTPEQDALLRKVSAQLDRLDAMLWNGVRQWGFDFKDAAHVDKVGFGGLLGKNSDGTPRSTVEALGALLAKDGAL